ncbi:MAG: class I SAM-dependent methyltransferase [bacterium]|nr:class I SAM-dependent methyltransferase [bacterium]
MAASFNIRSLVSGQEVLGERTILLSQACRSLFDGDGELLDSLTLAACPVCGSADLTTIFALRGFQHHQCRGCKFIFVNPRLSDRAAEAFYNSPYYESYYRMVELEQAKRGRLVSCSSPIKKLQTIVAEVGRMKPTGRVLDIGCGTGVLLSLFDQNRYSLQGVEINELCIKTARDLRGLNVDRTSLSSLRDGGKQYDVLLLVEVLEHLADPATFLADVASLASEKALLVISTPNIDNLTFHWLGAKCPHFCAPIHLNFFSLATLRKILESVGFSVVEYSYFGFRFSIAFAILSQFFDIDFRPPQSAEDYGCGSDLVFVRPKRDGSEVTAHPRSVRAHGAVHRRLFALANVLEWLNPVRWFDKSSHFIAYAQRS